MRTRMTRLCIASMTVSAALATMLTAATNAAADPPPPVDVVLREPPPAQRTLTVEWNPLALIVGKVSANVVIVPIDHHALVLSPFYASTTTVPIWIVDPNAPPNPMGGTNVQLPTQTFEGFGGEIGYRYYLGHGGPRGFFAGPSFIVASMTAKAQDSSQLSFWDYGLALDIGYEALVADRVALALGGGAQYVTTSKSIPDQQLPAAVYANSAVRPRALVSVGYAF
jgi:hypothetical protein